MPDVLAVPDRRSPRNAHAEPILIGRSMALGRGPALQPDLETQWLGLQDRHRFLDVARTQELPIVFHVEDERRFDAGVGLIDGGDLADAAAGPDPFDRPGREPRLQRLGFDLAVLDDDHLVDRPAVGREEAFQRSLQQIVSDAAGDHGRDPPILRIKLRRRQQIDEAGLQRQRPLGEGIGALRRAAPLRLGPRIVGPMPAQALAEVLVVAEKDVALRFEGRHRLGRPVGARLLLRRAGTELGRPGPGAGEKRRQPIDPAPLALRGRGALVPSRKCSDDPILDYRH